MCECICGDPEGTNADCERCDLINEIRELRSQRWHEVDDLSEVPKDTPLLLRLSDGDVRVGQYLCTGTKWFFDEPEYYFGQSRHPSYCHNEKCDCEAEPVEEYDVTHWHPMPVLD